MPDPVVLNNDDTFAQAFAQIAELDNAPAAPAEPAVVVPAPVEAPDPAAVAAEPAALPTPEEVAAAAAVAAEVPAVPAEPAVPAMSDDDLLRRLGGLIQKAPAPVEPEPVVAPAEPAGPTPFTTEEAELVAAYEKDFPDVCRAEAMIRRREYQTITGYIFQEISKELRPLVDMVQSIASRTHLGDLHTAVPDYDKTRDQVIAWAKSQPAYLQPAFNHVIQQGTVDEVSDLIQRFRRETGTAAPAAAAPVAAATPAPLPAAVVKAAAALAPVASKRSTAVAPSDPQDFSGAFDEAAKLLDKLP